MSHFETEREKDAMLRLLLSQIRARGRFDEVTYVTVCYLLGAGAVRAYAKEYRIPENTIYVRLKRLRDAIQAERQVSV